jgi:hypothetical protein
MIAPPYPVQHKPVPLMGFIEQEARDPANRGCADPGFIMNVTVRERAPVE